MKVQVVSPFLQVFDGKKYRFRSSGRSAYFKSKKWLHRVVWEYHHGAIPPNTHIHHKDGNPRNNQIENLEAMSASDHAKLSCQSKPKVDLICAYCCRLFQAIRNGKKNRYCGNRCREAAARERYRHTYDVERLCSVCGTPFVANKWWGGVTCSKKCSSEQANRTKATKPNVVD